MQPTLSMHNHTPALLPLQQLCSPLQSPCECLSSPAPHPSLHSWENSNTNPQVWYKPLLVTSQEISKSNKSSTGRSSSSHWRSPFRDVMDRDLASGIFFSPWVLTTQATAVSKVQVLWQCSAVLVRAVCLCAGIPGENYSDSWELMGLNCLTTSIKLAQWNPQGLRSSCWER